MLVKIVAVIPFIIFLVASIRALPTTPDRMKTLGKHLAVVGGLSIVAFLPFGYTPRVLSAALNEGSFSGGSLRPPEAMIATRAASLLRQVGLSRQVALSNRGIEALFLAVVALALLVLATSRRHAARAGAGASCSDDLCTLLALVTAMVPGLVHPVGRIRDPEDGHHGGGRTLAHCIGVVSHATHVRSGSPHACPGVLRRLPYSCSGLPHCAPGRGSPPSAAQTCQLGKYVAAEKRYSITWKRRSGLTPEFPQ